MVRCTPLRMRPIAIHCHAAPAASAAPRIAHSPALPAIASQRSCTAIIAIAAQIWIAMHNNAPSHTTDGHCMSSHFMALLCRRTAQRDAKRGARNERREPHVSRLSPLPSLLARYRLAICCTTHSGVIPHLHPLMTCCSFSDCTIGVVMFRFSSGAGYQSGTKTRFGIANPCLTLLELTEVAYVVFV